MGITFRLTKNSYNAVKDEIKKYSPKETILFSIAKVIKHSGGELYLASTLIIPDEEEAERRAATVIPSDKFQKWLYHDIVTKNKLLRKGFRVGTLHSHPFSDGNVSMSGIDWDCMRHDRKIYREGYDGYPFLWIVFNQNCSAFNGYVITQEEFLPISKITVYGKDFKMLENKKADFKDKNRELYSRMLLIPGYDHNKVSSQRIGIVGLGGLGSSVLQTIVELGIGDESQLVLIDHDNIEESNLSRIPYSSFKDIGKAKVKVASAYVKRVRPDRKVITIKKPCWDKRAQKELACCDFIIGCVDSELARTTINHISASYTVPLLDLGAGVLIEKFGGERIVISSGQARLFIPGATPCLLCNMGIDMAEKDKELAKIAIEQDEKERELLKRTGYITDLLNEDAPQPTVYNLNAIVSNLGVSMLNNYILGGDLKYHTLHFNLDSFEIQKMIAESNNLCPVCGEYNLIGACNPFKLETRKKNFPKPISEVSKDTSKVE